MAIKVISTLYCNHDIPVGHFYRAPCELSQNLAIMCEPNVLSCIVGLLLCNNITNKIYENLTKTTNNNNNKTTTSNKNNNNIQILLISYKYSLRIK